MISPPPPFYLPLSFWHAWQNASNWWWNSVCNWQGLHACITNINLCWGAGSVLKHLVQNWGMGDYTGGRRLLAEITAWLGELKVFSRGWHCWSNVRYLATSTRCVFLLGRWDERRWKCITCAAYWLIYLWALHFLYCWRMYLLCKKRLVIWFNWPLVVWMT